MDGTGGHDEGDSWTLDEAFCGLPLVCKVGLSLTVMMHWNLVSISGLSCKEAEKGMAWLSLVHCEMLDYACTAHFLSLKLTFPMESLKKKKKAFCLA